MTGGRQQMGTLESREKEARLEDCILDFLEKETKEPSSEAAIKILPEMAHTLVALWTLNRP